MDARSTSEAGTIGDVARVRALLVAAARDGAALSYSGLLNRLGLRFTRPKMRALCRTLDAIDQARRDAPALAVLVVREGDGLPGQGWWQGHVRQSGYAGPWTGPDATREVARLQRLAFAYWAAAHR